MDKVLLQMGTPSRPYEMRAIRGALSGYCRRIVTALWTVLMLAAPPTNAQAISVPNAEQLEAEARAQRVFSARLYLADLRRAELVTYSLLRAGTPYCANNRKYSLGIPPLSARGLPSELRRGFAEATAADDPNALRFMHVAPDSPAAKAGAEEGDVLLSITDRATGKQLTSAWGFDRPANTFVLNDLIAFEVRRNKTILQMNTRPQLICDFQPKLLRSEQLLAHAEARTLTLTTGLLRFVANDNELALLLANEIIHEQLRLNRLASRKHAASVPPPYAAADEQEADYLAAYLAASAGFDPAQGQDVWKRLASAPPSQEKAGIGSRHPLSAARSFQLNAVIEEIRRKALAAERLVPNHQTGIAFSDSDFDAATPRDPPKSAIGLETQAKEEDPRLRAVANIPFVDNEGLTGYQRFLDSPLRPRAFAIGPSKTSSRGAWAYRFGTNASADALAHCAVFARGPCYLYAVDDRVVWNAETARDQPESQHPLALGTLLAKPRATSFADIDDLSALPLPQAGISQYKAFLDSPLRPRAFAIRPSKTIDQVAWAYELGINAPEKALARCAEFAHAPCYLYAVNDSVVWGVETGPAKPLATGFAAISDLSAVPLPQAKLAKYKAFLEKPSPRTFVITQDGEGLYWIGPAAMRDALAHCARLSQPCWLYAVDDAVVWSKDVEKRISRPEQLPLQNDESGFLDN